MRTGNAETLVKGSCGPCAVVGGGAERCHVIANSDASFTKSVEGSVLSGKCGAVSGKSRHAKAYRGMSPCRVSMRWRRESAMNTAASSAEYRSLRPRHCAGGTSREPSWAFTNPAHASTWRWARRLERGGRPGMAHSSGADWRGRCSSADTISTRAGEAVKAVASTRSAGAGGSGMRTFNAGLVNNSPSRILEGRIYLMSDQLEGCVT